MLSNDRASSTCAPVGRGLLNHSLSGIPNTRPIATRPTNQRSRRRPSNARPIHATASMPSATARSPSMSPIHAKLAATEPSNDCAHSDTERSICNVFGPLATYPSNANHIASTPITHQGTVMSVCGRLIRKPPEHVSIRRSYGRTWIVHEERLDNLQLVDPVVRPSHSMCPSDHQFVSY